MNTIIESRQLDAVKVMNNGEWLSSLSTPVLIEDGDSIEVSKCFVDTISEGDQKIEIEKDITLKLNNVIYVSNTIQGMPSGTNIFSYDDEANGNGYSHAQDGYDYVWSERVDTADTRHNLPDLGHVTKVGLEMYSSMIPSQVLLGVLYLDVNGEEVAQNIVVPNPGNNFGKFQVDVSINCQLSSLKPNPYDINWHTYNFDRTLSVVAFTPGVDASFYEPLVFEKLINIDKGEYRPLDMVDIINDSLQENNSDTYGNFTIENAVNSPFMSTTAKALKDVSQTVVVNSIDLDGGTPSGIVGFNFTAGPTFTVGELIHVDFIMTQSVKDAIDLQCGANAYVFFENIVRPVVAFSAGKITLDVLPAGYYPSGPGTITLTLTPTANYKYNIEAYDTDLSHFVRTDGKRTLAPTNTAGIEYFIGTSQVELNYSADNSKFFWEYLHFPIYEAGNAIVSTFGLDPNLNKYFNVGKCGGIAFTSLTAYDRNDTTELYDFWQDKLGFNVGEMCARWTIVSETLLKSGDVKVPVFQNWGNGQTTTTARPTLDSVVEKKNYRVLAPDLTQLNSTNNLTTEIFAENSSAENDNLNYGYFLVDVNFGMANTLIGNNIFTTNINAIISRYFSEGSYTSYEADESMVYIHRGAPKYLNQVKVRILDSNHELASDISDDNSIFIRVVKALPNKKNIEN